MDFEFSKIVLPFNQIIRYNEAKLVRQIEACYVCFFFPYLSDLIALCVCEGIH